MLMTAVRRNPGRAWTYVEKELNDKGSPAYALRTQLKIKRATAVLKEFVTPLVSKGYLGKRTIKGGYGAYEVADRSALSTPSRHPSRPFHAATSRPPPLPGVPRLASDTLGVTSAPPSAAQVIDLLDAGGRVLNQLSSGGGGPLMLPVPEVVRRADKKAAEEAAALRTQVEQALRARGVDTSLVPESELQPYVNGGPVSEAILSYTNTIAGWRARGNDARADAHEELLER